MKTTFIAALLLPAAIGIFSCRPNRLNTAVQDERRLNTFFSNNGPKAESFTLDAATGGTVTTTNGTKVSFAPRAFINADGDTVTGPVNVGVTSIMKVPDMIMADKPTVDAKGNFLLSFGEIIVKASNNGGQLGVNPGQARVAFTRSNKERQAGAIPIWHGDTTITLETFGHDRFNVPTTVTTSHKVPKGVEWVDIGAVATPNPAGTENNFVLDALGQWRNCDELYNIPGTKITVLGYFKDHFNSSSMLYFKPANRTTLIKLYNPILNAPDGYNGFLSYQASFTVGLTGTFLAITSSNGKFYAEKKSVAIPAPAPGNNYVGIDLNPQEVSEAGLLALIQGMN